MLGQYLLTVRYLVDAPAVAGASALSAVPALALVVFVHRSDATAPRTGALGTTVALDGLAAGLAGVLNGTAWPVFDRVPVVGAALFFALFVAPVEEVVKLAAVRAYAYEEAEFTEAVDGAVHGAAAGLGFAAVENLAFVVQGVQAAGAPSLAVTLDAAATRAVVGPGHVIYTAIAGYYL